MSEQSANTATLENVLSTVDISPETFLQSSPAIHAASLVAAKRLLDPVIAHYSSFNELALRGLDTEQVWEQIRLVSEQVKSVVESRGGLNGDTISGSVNGIKDLANDQTFVDEDQLDDESMDEEDEEESLDEDEDMEDDEENSMDEDEGDESDDNEFPMNPERDEESDVEETTTAKPFKKDIHGLNDEFFSIDDFNRLSEQQDGERSDDENADEIDYFADPDEQDEEDDEDDVPDEITYKDFYLPPPNATSHKRKRAHFQDPLDLPAEEDALDDEARTTRFHKDLFAEDPLVDPSQTTLSTHAKRKVAIQAQVKQLEQENVSNKEWMYIGEATATDRPKNSLLEVADQIQVERNSKPVPIITEERTRSLEEIIKDRILENNFDDVKRKLPVSLVQKSRPITDQDMDLQEPGAKPTKGLAELYEQDHLRRIDPANNPTPLTQSVQNQHAEIDQLWTTLSHQLDSLTSWRFIPTPETISDRVVTNIPAVDMEDARPEAEAGAMLLAPQEVYRPEAKRGEVVVGGVPVAKVEMSRETKARVRRRQLQRGERQKKSVSTVEGSRKDVVETLKSGGVKIIANGRAHGRRAGPTPKRGGRIES